MMIDNIEVFTQSSIRLRGEGKTIYTDPFRINGMPKDADFILVTHDHYDHYSAEDIVKAANNETVFIVPKRLEGQLKKLMPLSGKIFTVEPGKSYEIEGLTLETVPAYNRLKPFHPKSAGWVGYILTLEGERIYMAGDTDMTKENQSISCDIAMVPIGGTYTMEAKQAAELVNSIKPKIAVPIHYGSIVGSPSDADVFRAAVDPSVTVVTKIAF